MVKLFLIVLTTSAILSCHRPLQRTSSQPLKVVVISDLNSGYGATTYDPEVHTAVAIAIEFKPDLVLIGGDMIAGQRPTLTDENVRAMWAAFDSAVAAPFRRARIPYAFTLGNHDASGHPAHARDRRLAAEFWNAQPHTPALRYTDRSVFPRYYAFTMGNVFFIAMDASTGNVYGDSAQISWLRSTLASQAARKATMRVVLGHVPLYAVAEGRNLRGEIQGQPDSLRALLEAGQVTMHVSGHHHAYYPAARGSLELLHAGAAGSGPRPLIGTTTPPYRTITLLRFFGDRDSISDHTFRIDGSTRTRVLQSSLPERIDGINGYVVRRDLHPTRANRSAAGPW